MLFEHADDPTRERCRIERHGLRVIVQRDARVETFDHDELDAASAEYDRQVSAVYTRGYRLVRDWVDPPLAHDPQLEAMIAEDPDDEARWMVLADWVLTCDDVRAHIVRFEQTRRSRDPSETWGQYPIPLFGDDDAAALLTDPLSRGEWQAGHVRACRLQCDAELIAAFVAAPATRLVRQLELDAWGGPSLLAALRALAGAPCKRTLRRLKLVANQPIEVDAIAPLLAGGFAVTTLGFLLHNDQDVDALLSALAGSPLLPQLKSLELGRGVAQKARQLPALAHLVAQK